MCLSECRAPVFECTGRLGGGCRLRKSTGSVGGQSSVVLRSMLASKQNIVSSILAQGLERENGVLPGEKKRW